MNKYTKKELDWGIVQISPLKYATDMEPQTTHNLAIFYT